jgi:hypothetical protein
MKNVNVPGPVGKFCQTIPSYVKCSIQWMEIDRSRRECIRKRDEGNLVDFFSGDLMNESK